VQKVFEFPFITFQETWQTWLQFRFTMFDNFTRSSIVAGKRENSQLYSEVSSSTVIRNDFFEDFPIGFSFMFVEIM
jgi:hypothetical protein